MNVTSACRAASPGLPSRETARPATLAGISLGRGRINVVGVEAKLVVNLALLGIAEDFVRFRKSLELLFGGLIAGIHVGMVLARKLAERLLDFVGRGRLLDTQRRVVVFGLGRHC